MLGSCSAMTGLKFFILFEKGALCFRFVLGSANYVAVLMARFNPVHMLG